MKVIINHPVQCQDVWYTPEPYAQDLPDAIGAHLVSIGAARELETKVVEVTEKKPLSVSQADPVSPPTMQTKRRGRKPKS